MRGAEFLTVADVAKSLNITRQTVAKYIFQKELNAVKMNKSYRIAYTDYQVFLERHAIQTISQIKTQRNTRNCTLEYDGKVAEQEVLENQANGTLRLVGKQQHNDLSFDKFIFGDNLQVLKLLLPDYRGRVDLIYIDPPFGTGQDFSDINDGMAYSDKLVDSEFLEFLRKRLILLRELMSDRGSIYLHIDKKIGHYVKIVMDEVFGYQNFINDITRIKCNPKNFARNAYGNYSDMILFYVKKRDFNIWNEIKEKLDKDSIEELFSKTHPKHGRYTTNPIHAPGTTDDGDTGKEWKGLLPPKGRHWRYSRAELTRLDQQGLIEWSSTGNPRKIIFAKDHEGVKVQDVWQFKDKGISYVDYPTQKNHNLLERIILNSSNRNSIVLDCFAGSGGTLLTAHRLGRKFIGIDNSTQSMKAVGKTLKRCEVKYNMFEFKPRT